MNRADLERRFYTLFLADQRRWTGKPSQSPRYAEQCALVDAVRALHPAPVAPRPLTELPADTTREAFLQATDGLRRPVVIRGFADHMPAVRTWTQDHLRERLGETSCAIVHYDDASLERAWDTGVEIAPMRFADYLAKMADGRVYLNNSSELFTKHPDLLADLDIQRLRDQFCSPGRWDELLTTQLFIGGRIVRSALHAAFGGNFFLQLAGRKRWVLMDPAHSVALHAIPGRPFQYVISAAGRYWGADNPVLERIPRREVTLNPGDLLYNTPWWWHDVQNLDDFTVGCAVRHFPTPGHRSPSWANHAIFTRHSTYPRSRATMFAHRAAASVGLTGPSMQAWANQHVSERLNRSFARWREERH